MRLFKINVAILAVCFLTHATLVQAEDLNEIFKRVNELVAKKNFPKALDELAWANKEIEKMNTEALRAFFPEDLSGFKGEKFETSSALGFTNIERNYRKPGGNSSIKVSLTGGNNNSGVGGLGGLAAMGRMAANVRAGRGAIDLPLDGRTATLSNDAKGGPEELTVFLESGSILKLDANNISDSETLKTAAKAINLNGLENYLRGSGNS